MQRSIYLCRILFVCIFILLLSACHKDDFLWPGPGNKPCKCDAQSLSIWYYNQPGQFLFGRQYQFFKTYSWQEFYYSIFILADSPTPVYPHSYVNGGRMGNKAFLLDSTSKDTAFTVILNSKGQPVETFYTDPMTGGFTWHKTYAYNNKGQLVSYFNPEQNWDYTIRYDQHGNVKQYLRNNNSTLMLELTYDYSKPITSGVYFIDSWYGHFTELELLRHMGLLDMHPHHKLIRANNAYQYPEYDRYFFDQQINSDGYVTSYNTTLWYPSDTLSVSVNWHCAGQSQQAMARN